jgi:phosphatidate phosphatase LPIN
MTDLVDQTFPPIHRKWTPEFTDFNYWKIPLQQYALPDVSPLHPYRNSHLRQMSSFEKLSSTLAFMTGINNNNNNNGDGSRRSASPDMSSSYAGSDDEDGDESELDVDGRVRTRTRAKSVTSMPGTLDQMHFDMDGEEEDHQEHFDHYDEGEESYGYNEGEIGVQEEVEEEFDDDLLAAGAMRKVPFLYGS